MSRWRGKSTGRQGRIRCLETSLGMACFEVKSCVGSPHVLLDIYRWPHRHTLILLSQPHISGTLRTFLWAAWPCHAAMVPADEHNTVLANQHVVSSMIISHGFPPIICNCPMLTTVVLPKLACGQVSHARTVRLAVDCASLSCSHRPLSRPLECWSRTHRALNYRGLRAGEQRAASVGL